MIGEADTCEDWRKRHVSEAGEWRQGKEYLSGRKEWQCERGKQDRDSHDWSAGVEV